MQSRRLLALHVSLHLRGGIEPWRGNTVVAFCCLVAGVERGTRPQDGQELYNIWDDLYEQRSFAPPPPFAVFKVVSNRVWGCQGIQYASIRVFIPICIEQSCVNKVGSHPRIPFGSLPPLIAG